MKQEDLKLKFKRNEKFKEIVLLFSAMNIPFEIRSEGNFKIILVEKNERRNALSQIYCYRKENQLVLKDVLSEKDKFDYFSYYLVIVVFFSFYLFQMMEKNFFLELNILELGVLSVKKVWQNEWYRLITALTLHADFLHILSNALFGGLIIYFVLKKIGKGTGWFFVLISGIAGNLISVLVQHETYVALGSSTACFGALGLLTGERIFNSGRTNLIIKNTAFLPFASSLAFLGLFGTSAGSDITAHFSGYLCGLLIGSIYTFSSKKVNLKNRFLNIFFGCLSVLIIVLSWVMAFTKISQ